MGVICIFLSPGAGHSSYAPCNIGRLIVTLAGLEKWKTAPTLRLQISTVYWSIILAYVEFKRKSFRFDAHLGRFESQRCPLVCAEMQGFGKSKRDTRLLGPLLVRTERKDEQKSQRTVKTNIFPIFHTRNGGTFSHPAVEKGGRQLNKRVVFLPDLYRLNDGGASIATEMGPMSAMAFVNCSSLPFLILTKPRTVAPRQSGLYRQGAS